jgi:hypothetical protein
MSFFNKSVSDYSEAPSIHSNQSISKTGSGKRSFPGLKSADTTYTGNYSTMPSPGSSFGISNKHKREIAVNKLAQLYYDLKYVDDGDAPFILNQIDEITNDKNNGIQTGDIEKAKEGALILESVNSTDGERDKIYEENGKLKPKLKSDGKPLLSTSDVHGRHMEEINEKEENAREKLEKMEESDGKAPILPECAKNMFKQDEYFSNFGNVQYHVKLVNEEIAKVRDNKTEAGDNKTHHSVKTPPLENESDDDDDEFPTSFHQLPDDFDSSSLSSSSRTSSSNPLDNANSEITEHLKRILDRTDKIAPNLHKNLKSNTFDFGGKKKYNPFFEASNGVPDAISDHSFLTFLAGVDKSFGKKSAKTVAMVQEMKLLLILNKARENPDEVIEAGSLEKYIAKKLTEMTGYELRKDDKDFLIKTFELEV